ncbi:MAG: hypothetical protein H7067_11650, partial [Burkholderiales bacterium]|nr:hypothetical protein [Opitutaceae bacterium]
GGEEFFNRVGLIRYHRETPRLGRRALPPRRDPLRRARRLAPRLLIGYNRATGEVAFSDSWGPEFAERWLPAAAARQVSHGQAWVLDF